MVPFLKSRYRLIRLGLEPDILTKLKTIRVHTLNACSNPSEGGQLLGAFEVG
jgi:hypothetical protein